MAKEYSTKIKDLAKLIFYRFQFIFLIVCSILLVKLNLQFQNLANLMQKSKREKQQKQLRQSLKTYLDLSNHLYAPEKANLLSKMYPQIASINSLRIFAVLEVLYLLDLSISVLQKKNPDQVSNFKIGIIGGGITARLILHSILPLSKDGIDLKNITLSTRQTEHFSLYAQNFGIKVVFDNESTAVEADFLIIATPATLDNWIIADLKQPLQFRVSGQQKKQNKAIPNMTKTTIEKPQLPSGGPSTFSGENNQKTLQITGSLQMPKQSEKFMKPLVYILTSDFTEQKCNRFFEFPVLVPSIRAKDLKALTQHFQTLKSQYDSIQMHQKAYSQWIGRAENEERKIESRQGHNQLESYDSYELETKINKYFGTPFLKILIALNYAFGSPLNIASLGSSLSITISVHDSVQGKKKDETIMQILESATLSGEIDETFMKKCKKWRMVHNNFIA